ncbi:MAG: Fic family protein, partial [Candidatus Pararuminococcus gallinarum]
HLSIKIKSITAFIVFTAELVCLIERIYQKSNKLNRLMSPMPNVARDKYQENCLIDEVMLTNDIEGIYSTRREVIEAIESSKKNEKEKRFEGLVKKYVALSKNQGDSIKLKTCQDIRNLYNEIVLNEISEENYPDGKYFRKDIVNVLSGTQKEKHKGLYPEKVIIDNMEKSINLLDDSNLPDMVKIALFHYLIGYIHPFYDGNGRLSRFITSCLLHKYLNPLVAFRITYTIKNNISEYYKGFDICNNEKNSGDLTPFVIIFLGFIENSIESMIERIRDGRLKLDYYWELLDKTTVELSKDAVSLLFIFVQNSLFSNESLSVDEIAKNMEKSTTTIRNLISYLIELGCPIEKIREGHKLLYHTELNQLEEFLKV